MNLNSAMAFRGNGTGAGDTHILYFTAGIAGGGALEGHGLFGSVVPIAPITATATEGTP